MKNNFISYTISFLWALFEATFFFIIPDVWLSFNSVDSLKKGFKNMMFAIIGALFGGTLMFILGSYNITSVNNMLINIPLIDANIINQVNDSIQSDGLLAIFMGPLKGIPYKIYASYSGALALNYLMFMLISIFARGIRFSISIIITNLLSRTLLIQLTLINKRIIITILWLLIYIMYFSFN